jgi:nucleoside-diphosphate-sugar epimerase
MQDTSADIFKARKLLGWQPEVSPQQGLRRAVAWHQENAEWLDKLEL